MSLPPFLLDLLRAPPRAGAGVHAWLFRVARQLHAHYLPADIVQLLEARVAQCGRVVPRTEIVQAVKNSLGCAWQPRDGSPAAPAQRKWPEVDNTRRAAIIRDGGGLVDLWELSPWRIEDARQRAEDIIDRLFPGNPLLCCGKSQAVFDTRPREQWRGQLAELALIVPSPMSAVEGVTKEGNPSRHTLSNTGGRRFLVCEFDSGEIDHQAALLLHLAIYAPMVCALHSGGKSMHGWFLCAGQREEKILKFFRYAVSLGADPVTWTRSQFVRLPDGRRDSGKRQTVFYFAPQLIK
ncbi:MAG: hypothetical protein KGL39_50020 [Patescibacteria group bacterium]|nr:hypothetical protein [Patescibacteria group bacterium]